MTGTFLAGLALLTADPKVELSDAEHRELQRAMAAPALDRLDAMLRAHPDLLTRPIEGSTTLIQAAAAMQWSEAAAHLRRRGATVDTYSAVALGWDDEVRRLATADPKSLDFRHWGQTVLQVAVERDQPATLRLLLDLGARIDVPPAEDQEDAPNVLATAVGAGRPDFLRQLLDRTGDRAWNRLGPGAVALACFKPREQTAALLNLLLARKPPLASPTWDGPACLRSACTSGNVAAVRALLKAGVPPDGYPPPDHRERVYDPLVRVMYAARGLSHALHPQSPEDPANPPSPDPDQIRLTTQIFATKLPGLLFPFAGASARTREQMGMAFPLHLAGVSDEIADDRVRIEVADLLLAAGAKWDFPAAVAFGKAEVVRKMLADDPGLTRAVVYRVITHPESWRQGRRTYDLRGDHNGPWWEDVSDGTSVVYALEAAAARGDTDVLRVLLTRPQPRLPFGGSLVMSAFGAAVKAGRVGPMKALTADSANAAAARKDLRWMWTPAARSGSVAVLDVLAGLRKPTDDEVIGALHVAAEAGHLDFVQRLFELRGRPGPNQYSWPLPLAACGGYPHVVRWLLDRGGDPNWTDDAGNTSIRAAAEAGHTVCLKLLLDRKPAVDPRGYLGRTPLLAAAAADRVEAFQLLLAAGADRRAVDDDKNTALHLAASSGSLEIVELLLKTGADPAARNAHGQTPADVAWQKCGFPDAGPPKPQGKVYFRLEAARKK